MRRSTSCAVAAVTAVAVIGFSATGVGARSAGKKDSGVVYLHIVNQKGGLLYAAGIARSKLFGQIAVTYVVKVGSSTPGTFHITAKKVTLYLNNGSITGKGSATQTVTSTSSTVSNGKVNLTRGAGGQAGHTFVGTFSGTFDSTSGVYTFHYKARYR